MPMPIAPLGKANASTVSEVEKNVVKVPRSEDSDSHENAGHHLHRRMIMDTLWTSDSVIQSKNGQRNLAAVLEVCSFSLAGAREE